jgi:alginate O-acetyltransferase complex protein AlgI
MIFNSLDFAVFLPIVFILYWFGCDRHIKLQNLLIVIASYVFYGWWDWRFLSLIVFSTLVDYGVGLGLSKQIDSKKRKLLLALSIMVNLGLLGFFKYYNFFLDSFIHSFSFFGMTINANSLNVILPVGISFYTFQTLSYSIDVYRNKLAPTRDFIAFSAFVSFFPQLVAGPIERATHLLPQFYQKRTFVYHRAVDGMRQMLWGFFKKIVIADNCAEYANEIFNNHLEYSSAHLVMGAIFFSFQIYADFSGYSDIAIGTSRLFGFDLMQNFRFPYFSRDVGEFWRRWHISLSTWFRDYLYIPLGGSKMGTWGKIRNTFIIFIVSGFWHGANWTFVIWGALNALYFLPLLLFQRNRVHLDDVAADKTFPSLMEGFKLLTTFALITFAWIFFRAENLNHALSYISGLSRSPGSFFLPSVYLNVKTEIIFILGFFIIEWFGRHHQHALQKLQILPSRVMRWAFYLSLAVIIILFSGKEQEFIYFQF